MQRRVEHHGYVIIASPGVQGRGGADASPLIGAFHPDHIVAAASPEGDALGEVAGSRVGAVGDVGRRKAADKIGGEQHRRGGRAIACGSGLIAHHEQIAPGAGMEVQLADDQIKMAGEEVRGGRGREIRGGGNIETIVAGVGVHVGNRAVHGATDVEDVVTGAEVNVEGVDAVVVQALDPVRHGNITRHSENHVLTPERPLEVDQELITHLQGKSITVAQKAPERSGEIVSRGIPSQCLRRRSMGERVRPAGRSDPESDRVVHRRQI